MLVVDDDADVREALHEVLADEGYHVTCTANGREALTWLRSHPAPSLILLDLVMPEMDGPQFRAQQRRDPSISAIPVVLLSGDVSFSDRARALDAAGTLAKPVRLDDLIATVIRHCGRPPAAQTGRGR